MHNIVSFHRHTKTNMEELKEVFLKFRQASGVSRNTYFQNETNISLFIDWCKENDYHYVEHLNKFVLYDYISYLHKRNNMNTTKDKKLSAATISAHVKVLKVFFRFLEEHSFCRDLAKELPSPSIHHQIIEAFTDEQIELIFLHTKQEKYRILFYLLLTTGLRISEALSLKLENFHFQRRLIRVTGKGNKQREVPFPKELENLIVWFARNKKLDEYIWTGKKGDILTTAAVRNELYRIKRKIGDKAGFNSIQVRPHVFRHTFAKKWIMNGGDPFSLQRILGHSRLDMTMRYVHMWGDDLVKKHERFAPKFTLMEMTEK
jgi:site-specific recombinase XerD